MKKNLIFLVLLIGCLSTFGPAHADSGSQTITPKTESNVTTLVSIVSDLYVKLRRIPLIERELQQIQREREKYKRLKETCDRARIVYAPAKKTYSGNSGDLLQIDQVTLTQHSLKVSRENGLHDVLVKNARESLQLLFRFLPLPTNGFWSLVGGNIREDVLKYARSIEADIQARRYGACVRKVDRILVASKGIEI